MSNRRPILTLKSKRPAPVAESSPAQELEVAPTDKEMEQLCLDRADKVVTGLAAHLQQTPAGQELLRLLAGSCRVVITERMGRAVTCSSCGEPGDRPGQYYCSKCNADYHRDYQAARRETLIRLIASIWCSERTATRRLGRIIRHAQDMVLSRSPAPPTSNCKLESGPPMALTAVAVLHHSARKPIPSSISKRCRDVCHSR